jgi:hypothetical protein
MAMGLPDWTSLGNCKRGFGVWGILEKMSRGMQMVDPLYAVDEIESSGVRERRYAARAAVRNWGIEGMVRNRLSLQSREFGMKHSEG